MNFRPGLSLVLVLALAACRDGGGDESGTGTGTDTGSDTEVPSGDIELDDFFGLAEAAYCEWAVECHAFGVEARCASVMHFEKQLNMRWLAGVGANEAVPTAYYKEAVEVGRIAYDKKAAAECLAYVRGRTCDVDRYHEATEEELAGQLACAGLFTGRMGRNGPCLSALECADTAVCGFDPTCVDMCCVGACRVLAEPLALGEVCGNSSQSCAAGSYCRFDPNSGNGTCSTPPGVGQPCPDYVCDSDSLCDWNGTKDICMALRPAGKACDYDDQCAKGLACKRDQNYENGVCFKPADQGEVCDPNSPDQVCRRFDNYCDPGAKTCGPLPGNGEPCFQYSCRGDFFCVEGNGPRCSPVADEGEGCGYQPNTGNYVPCSGDNACVDEEFDGGTCVAPTGASDCPVPADPLDGGADAGG